VRGMPPAAAPLPSAAAVTRATPAHEPPPLRPPPHRQSRARTTSPPAAAPGDARNPNLQCPAIAPGQPRTATRDTPLPSHPGEVRGVQGPSEPPPPATPGCPGQSRGMTRNRRRQSPNAVTLRHPTPSSSGPTRGSIQSAPRPSPHRRHGRACPGHPRPRVCFPPWQHWRAGVDDRLKSGHDGQCKHGSSLKPPPSSSGSTRGSTQHAPRPSPAAVMAGPGPGHPRPRVCFPPWQHERTGVDGRIKSGHDGQRKQRNVPHPPPSSSGSTRGSIRRAPRSSPHRRHGRARPGHPRPRMRFSPRQHGRASWMGGPSPAMTTSGPASATTRAPMKFPSAPLPFRAGPKGGWRRDKA
jgi:hypothetical protein